MPAYSTIKVPNPPFAFCLHNCGVIGVISVIGMHYSITVCLLTRIFVIIFGRAEATFLQCTVSVAPQKGVIFMHYRITVMPHNPKITPKIHLHANRRRVVAGRRLAER